MQVAKLPTHQALRTDLLAIIDHAISLQATDIFLSSGKPPRIRRNGQIAVVSSLAGFIGLPYSASYNASKAAVRGQRSRTA